MTLAVIFAGFGLLSVTVGCSSAQRSGERRPTDFTLDALVVNPESALGETPRWRRQARYVLEADGELRVAVGPGVGDRTIPRRTRKLGPGERDEVWTLTRDAGLLEAESPRVVPWGQTWRAPPGEVSAVFSVTGGGRRVHSAAPMGASSGLGAPRVEALLDRLGELAWIPERD